MEAERFKLFLENQVNDFNSGEIEYLMLAKYKALIKDSSYFDFAVDSQNCGFFYGQSIHIYGYSNINDFHDIDKINSLLQNEYGHIIDGLISFGQDLYGNQFCFDKIKNEIIFLDSETGEKEIIASSFTSFIYALYERTEYFTGINILNGWLLNNRFDFNQRLCPKIPFIMGGEFEVKNLYACKFPDFIRSYANIARQVYNLPEGTKVKLIIGK